MTLNGGVVEKELGWEMILEDRGVKAFIINDDRASDTCRVARVDDLLSASIGLHLEAPLP